LIAGLISQSQFRLGCKIRSDVFFAQCGTSQMMVWSYVDKETMTKVKNKSLLLNISLQKVHITYPQFKFTI